MKNFCSWWNLLIEIFQINDLGEISILKQRTGYITARSPGLLVLSGHEDPSLSSCCREISVPLCHFWHSVLVFLHSRAALSESTVLVWLRPWEMPLSFLIFSRRGTVPSTLRSAPGWPWSQAQKECMAFSLRTPLRASLLDSRDRCSRTGVCGRRGVGVCACIERVGFATSPFIFPNALSCLFIHSAEMHWAPTVFWAQGWDWGNGSGLDPSWWKHSPAGTDPCQPHSLSVL